jgi:hypothetical protein
MSPGIEITGADLIEIWVMKSIDVTFFNDAVLTA